MYNCFNKYQWRQHLQILLLYSKIIKQMFLYVIYIYKNTATKLV